MFPTFSGLVWAKQYFTGAHIRLVEFRACRVFCDRMEEKNKANELAQHGKMPSMGGIMKKISSGKLSKSGAARKEIGKERDRAKNRWPPFWTNI